MFTQKKICWINLQTMEILGKYHIVVTFRWFDSHHPYILLHLGLGTQHATCNKSFFLNSCIMRLSIAAQFSNSNILLIYYPRICHRNLFISCARVFTHPTTTLDIAVFIRESTIAQYPASCPAGMRRLSYRYLPGLSCSIKYRQYSC